MLSIIDILLIQLIIKHFNTLQILNSKVYIFAVERQITITFTISVTFKAVYETMTAEETIILIKDFEDMVSTLISILFLLPSY